MTDFARGGIPLLIEPQFLAARDCERIRRAMDRGDGDAAEIVGDTIVTSSEIRRTVSIEIDPAVREWFERRLDECRPTVARALGRPLGHREGSGFLRYSPGGFYRPHRDRGDVAGWPDAARRTAAVVVFLNHSKTIGRNGFDGGTLRLYPEEGSPPLDFQPETGLLVAFPAETLHEVLPVHAGIRDAAVDWFYEA